jgi:uncharacterized protein YrrD
MALKTRRELTGLAVVTLTGGERLGRVEDVVFRPATGEVAGFLIDRGGMFSKARFLATNQVQGLGADALTITGEEALMEAAPASAGEIAAKPLEGRPVLNQAGTILGKVADVAVDTETLLVPHLLLATGLVDNALHGKPQLPLSLVQTIGADSVIVSNAYDPKSPATHV